MNSGRLRVGLLAGVVALACFIEPFIQVTRYYPWTTVPANRFSAFAPVTQFLRQYPPEQNRVYSYFETLEDLYTPPERPTDSLNLTALAGLHNVGGYEPLIQKRYSLALNYSTWQRVFNWPAMRPFSSWFESNSHVPDLLNTTFAIVHPESAEGPKTEIEKDGIAFSAVNLRVNPGRYNSTRLTCDDEEGDTLALVTALS